MQTWHVPYIDLAAQNTRLQAQLVDSFTEVMENAAFILRNDVRDFEKRIAEVLNVSHVIGVNSGTDALYLTMQTLELDRGDEVITVAHTFVATVAAIVHAGGTPVFVDIGDDFNMDPQALETAITPQTKAILPVHLNGRMCNMERILAIAEQHEIPIIEDAAQALGARFKTDTAGTLGLAGCFSLHPMKILSCLGDGGFITTRDDTLAAKLRLLRDHGQKTKNDLLCFGYNSRLDNLQAAFLNIKLPYLNQYIHRRREIAALYNRLLQNSPLLLPPAPDTFPYFDSYASYVIRTEYQQELYSYLRDMGIEVYIHLQRPIHSHKKLGLTKVHLPNNEKLCREILSLPIYPEMTDDQVKYVVHHINLFYSTH